MSNVRDSDPSLWLHNKLGSSDSWTTGSISSQLDRDVLRNIKDCFIDLQGPVKVKLLLSFFHIPKRNLDEWRVEIEDILEVAQADGEQWVAMLAEIMKSYPSRSMLNFEITEPEENHRIFMDLVEEVSKELKRGKELNLLPMECHYVNKSVLTSMVGPQKSNAKHFKMQKTSKSATLRFELVCKATDAAKTTAKKMPAPTVPLRTRGMPRKMTDTTPLKGLPSYMTGKVPTAPTAASRTLSRTPAGRKEGGVKLLDIADQPIGYGLAKRRKKAQEQEEAKKPSQPDEAENTLQETPDYAVGLPTGEAAPPSPPVSQLRTSSYVTPEIAPPGAKSYLPPAAPQQIPQASPIPAPIVTPLYVRSNPTAPNRGISLTPFIKAEQAVGIISPTSEPIPTQKIPAVGLTPTQTLTKTVILQVPTAPSQQVVTLSKELMEKAQQIFRSANKATRPEKEHILKFMAGTRENPCPELGSIVTIKLSEAEEFIPKGDGSIPPAFVETHFQMNYNTGEWKVIQKPPKAP